MTTIWQRALHPLGPVGAQGLSQAANLAAQLALIAFMGKTRFADLGLGLMTAATICFISEIGLGTYFLRESARSEQWLDSWRQSVGSRLIVAATAAALAWAALAWGGTQPGHGTAGFAGRNSRGTYFRRQPDASVVWPG